MPELARPLEVFTGASRRRSWSSWQKVDRRGELCLRHVGECGGVSVRLTALAAVRLVPAGRGGVFGRARAGLRIDGARAGRRRAGRNDDPEGVPRPAGWPPEAAAGGGKRGLQPGV